jgi:hypothetical protein
MSDFAEGELDKYRARCAEFLDANANDLSEYEDTISYDSSKGTPMEYAGHDLWLTEHGHGAGFWCRDLGELGDRLTSAVIDRCGEGVPYLANGKVYVS